MSIVNKKQLSDIVGKSERTLTEWDAKGMPIQYKGGRGRSNEYDTGAVIEWMIQRAMSGEKQETARERRDRLEADMVAIKAGKEVGLLGEVADMVSVWSHAIASVRSDMLALPDKLKADIDAQHGIDSNLEIYESGIKTALLKLSENPPVDDEVDGYPMVAEEGEA